MRCTSPISRVPQEWLASFVAAAVVCAVLAATATAAATEPQRQPPPAPGLPVDALLPPEPALHLSGEVDPALVKIIQTHRSRLESQPDDRELLSRLAMIYIANGLPEPADQTLERLIALESGNAQWRYHRAKVRAELGDLDGALRAIDQAVRLEPQRPWLHWRRGMWLMELDRPEDAEQAFATALILDPADRSARVHMAKLHLQQERYQAAAELLEQVIDGSTSDRYAHHLLAAAYRGQGRIDAAQSQAAMGKGAEPDWDDPWHRELGRYVVGYRAAIQRGQQLVKAGRFAEAVPILEKLRQERPDDVTVVLVLSAGYGGVGRAADAISLLQQATATIGDHYAFEVHLAQHRLTSQDAAGALEHVDRAIALDPQLAGAHLLKAVVLGQLGRSADAWKSWQRAAAITPEAPNVQSVAQQLRAGGAPPPPEVAPQGGQR